MFDEWISAFLLRLRTLFRRRQLDCDLEDELAFHHAMREDSLLEDGEPPAVAHHTARRHFGNATSIKETCRDLWTFRWLESLIQDIRYGIRILAKSRGFTIVAIVSLALGIGANTAIFTVIDAVLLANLPVRAPDELVIVNWTAAEARNISRRNSIQTTDKATGKLRCNVFPFATFERFRQESSGLSDVFAFVNAREVNIAHDGVARVAPGLFVSGYYYRGLGVTPFAGRLIDDADQQTNAPPVAVLSYQFWQEAFSMSEAAIGATLTVNGAPVTVIGVTPPEFYGVSAGGFIPSPDVTLPLSAQPGLTAHWNTGALRAQANVWWLNVMGRLAPGASIASVQRELENIFLQDVQLISETDNLRMNQPGILLLPGGHGVDTLRWKYSKPLWTLLAVAGLVLLIACTNLAGLLLARVTARNKEITVRLAMGASRFRVARQMLTESLLLSGIGGATGLLLSFWGSTVLLTTMIGPSEIARVSLTPDWRVLVFTLVVTLLTAIVFGLVPSLRASQVRLAPAIKEGASTSPVSQRGTGLSRLGRSLVAVQMAMSLMLLIGAGLFLRSLANLKSVDLGFRSDQLLLFRVEPGTIGYRDARLLNLYSGLSDRLAEIPGVRSVTTAESRLFTGSASNGPMYVSGATHLEKGRTFVTVYFVGPEYFETMGIPIVMGRDMRITDSVEAPRVVVLNQEAAGIAFPDGSPLGQQVSVFADTESGAEVVGVVQNTKFDRIRRDVPFAYIPYTQARHMVSSLDFVLRTAGRPEALTSHVREVVRRLDPNLPMTDVTTQQRQIDSSLRSDYLFARLSAAFSILALALACIGVYGVVAYSVARRTGEIGIRMALGAQRTGIVWLVLRQVVLLTLIGMAAGIAGALAATKTIASTLYQVEPTDTTTFIGAVAVLFVVAVLAGLHPAARAAGVNPSDALRSE